jgi:beta-lactamase class A
VRASRRPHGGGFAFHLRLPARDVTIRVTAVDRKEHGATTVVSPVAGLPAAAAPRFAWGRRDARLTRALTRLATHFPGTAAAYVESLTTGAGASWNARARFPAASTVKLAIAVQVLRSLGGRPPAAGTRVAALMDAMLIHSDNVAANELLIYLGGSTGVGAALVTEMLHELGLVDTEMFGGYIPGTKRPPGIPALVVSQPSFGIGKYTTAWDLARLLRYVYLAAGGNGPLATHVSSFTPVAARYLLFELTHVDEPGRITRFLGARMRVAHKAGWISTARHDNGIVFTRHGAILVTVMTWNAAGVGVASDVLAGRVARTALRLLRR